MQPGSTRLQPGHTVAAWAHGRLHAAWVHTVAAWVHAVAASSLSVESVTAAASSPLRLQVLPASLELPESIVDEVTKERFAATLADQRQVSSEHHLTSHLAPRTSHLAPPTSHLAPRTSHLAPLTFDFFSQRGVTDEKLKELVSPENYKKYAAVARPSIEASIKGDFALKELGRQQNLVVSEDEVEDEMMTLQAQALQRGEKFKPSEVRRDQPRTRTRTRTRTRARTRTRTRTRTRCVASLCRTALSAQLFLAAEAALCRLAATATSPDAVQALSHALNVALPAAPAATAVPVARGSVGGSRPATPPLVSIPSSPNPATPPSAATPGTPGAVGTSEEECWRAVGRGGLGMALQLMGDALARLMRLHPPGSDGHDKLYLEGCRLFNLIETRAGKPAMRQAATLTMAVLTMATLTAARHAPGHLPFTCLLACLLMSLFGLLATYLLLTCYLLPTYRGATGHGHVA